MMECLLISPTAVQLSYPSPGSTQASSAPKHTLTHTRSHKSSCSWTTRKIWTSHSTRYALALTHTTLWQQRLLGRAKRDAWGTVWARGGAVRPFSPHLRYWRHFSQTNLTSKRYQSPSASVTTTNLWLGMNAVRPITAGSKTNRPRPESVSEGQLRPNSWAQWYIIKNDKS